MGSLSRMSRCERFIVEFGQDAITKYGINAAWVTNQFLGWLDAVEEVRLFVIAKYGDNEIELMLSTPVFFWPEEDAEFTIERVSSLFDLDRDTAALRLRRARLIE